MIRKIIRVAILGLVIAGTSLAPSSSASAATLKLNLNGVAPEVYSATAATVPDVKISFNGLILTGWNTRADGKGASMKAGDAVTADTTLYAQWNNGTKLDMTCKSAEPEPAKTDDQSLDQPDDKLSDKQADDKGADKGDGDKDTKGDTSDDETNPTNPTGPINPTDDSASESKTDLNESDDDAEPGQASGINSAAGLSKNDSNAANKTGVESSKAGSASAAGSTSTGDGRSSTNAPNLPSAPLAGAALRQLVAPITPIALGGLALLSLYLLLGQHGSHHLAKYITPSALKRSGAGLACLTVALGTLWLFAYSTSHAAAGETCTLNAQPTYKNAAGQAYSGSVTIGSETTYWSGGAKQEFTPANVYRLYNPNGGGHFYTTSDSEAAQNMLNGMTFESILGTTARTGQAVQTVYRAYNKYNGDHVYSTQWDEISGLVKNGWANEDKSAFSAPVGDGLVPIYRLYNPNGGAHLYTNDSSERDNLVKAGFSNEGVVFSLNRPAPGTGHWQVFELAKGNAKGKYRYWFDSTGAIAHGRFIDPSSAADKDAGYRAYAYPDGHVLVNGIYCDSGSGMCYTADNDGRIVKSEKMEVGQHIVNLARATANSTHYYSSNQSDYNTRFERPTQPSLQTYAKVFDATVGSMKGFMAYASCTQAIIAATVDRSAAEYDNQWRPWAFVNYMNAHGQWYQNLGQAAADKLQPGDILATSEHTAIYLGPGSDSNHISVWQAHWSNGQYPSIDNETVNGYYSSWKFTVFRPYAKSNPIDVSNIVSY